MSDEEEVFSEEEEEEEEVDDVEEEDEPKAKTKRCAFLNSFQLIPFIIRTSLTRYDSHHIDIHAFTNTALPPRAPARRRIPTHPREHSPLTWSVCIRFSRLPSPPLTLLPFVQHFAQAKRAEIVAANPGIGITGVATKVSEIWKTLKPAGTRSFIP